MKIIDMTITYENGMTGMSKYHPVTEFKRLGKIEEIGRNTSSILLGSHIGTHMDAPSHFIRDGYTIEDTPIESCIGDVTVVDARHRGKGDRLRVEDLRQYELKERVLLVFGWSKYWKTGDYLQEFPYIDSEAAQYMWENGVKLIAMDTPSPDTQPKDEATAYKIHKFMLKKNVIFVESVINTDQIDFSKDYCLIALPLKLDKVDASPCRVVLIER
jgi:arylformamidase